MGTLSHVTFQTFTCNFFTRLTRTIAQWNSLPEVATAPTLDAFKSGVCGTLCTKSLDPNSLPFIPIISPFCTPSHALSIPFLFLLLLVCFYMHPAHCTHITECITLEERKHLYTGRINLAIPVLFL